MLEAGFAYARDLLRAAKRVLQDEKLPNVSFHLAVLALEEIGKGALLGARGISAWWGLSLLSHSMKSSNSEEGGSHYRK